MTDSQKNLLWLLNLNYNGQMPKNIDFKAVLNEALKQSVLLMVYDKLNETNAEFLAHAEKLTELVYSLMTKNMRANRAQAELVDLLENEGFDYVILKGEASAMYYNNPSLRSLGDVDFLIKPKDKADIDALLKQNGYTSSHEDHICHVVYKKGKKHLEMHFEVAGIPNGKTGEKVREYLKEVVDRPIMGENDYGGFYAPAHHYHAVILLLHMQHHMLSEGMGLRHLLDWGYFVNETYEMPFWEEDAIPFLKEIGLFTYACVMTKTCSIFFGTACPNWAKDTLDDVCEDIMEDILSGGNFGKKDSVRKASGLMVSNRGKDGTKHKKSYYLLKTLTASVHETHPITKKHKILFPVFFFYKAARHVVLIALGKRISFSKSIPQANKRKQLYDKLHIFEVE